MVLLFVCSGVTQPLLISTLGYNGAYEKSTLLFLLPNYVGMLMGGLLRKDVLSTGTFRNRQLALLCAIDVVSQFLCQYGLTVAGSSLYIIIYSSSTMWIAVESRVLLRKRLATAQWLGCAIVVLGLALTGGDLLTSERRSDAEVVLGAIMILVGAASHALTWVLVESVLKEADPIQPEAISAVMGFVGVGVFGSWQVVYTLPRADELIADQIAAKRGSVTVIVIVYAVLTAASMVHAVTFYHLVGKLGAVTAGVMKGVQAAAVFVCSHYLFCGLQASQCFSYAKACSLVLVLVGTTTYGLSESVASQATSRFEGTAAAKGSAMDDAEDTDYVLVTHDDEKS